MSSLERRREARQAIADYQRLRDVWRRYPVIYARQRLGLNPTRQQREMMEAIAPPGAHVTVRSGHGIGKTSALSALIWWHLECFDFCRIPCTAPTASQLFLVLWAELSKWVRRADEQSKVNGLDDAFALSRLFNINQERAFDPSASNEWFAVARTARKENPDALQGFHASDLIVTDDDKVVQRSGSGGALMFVIEEASGVPDQIFEAAQGALSSKDARLIMVGNPVRSTGFFADSHMRSRSSYTALHFSGADSPLVEKDYYEKLAKKYGPTSNVVRVRWAGEFPKQDDDVLIPLELVELALLRDPQPTEQEQGGVLGVDVARFGDDRTTFVYRTGRWVRHVEVHGKIDTMATVGHASRLNDRFKPKIINVDVDGVGGGPADRMKELRMPVRGVHALEAATMRPQTRKPGRFSERAPQFRFDRQELKPQTTKEFMWLEMCNWFADSEPTFSGCDRELAQDLAGEAATVKYSFDSTGRIFIERKEELKRRGLRSPDLADALALTFAPERLSVWERMV